MMTLTHEHELIDEFPDELTDDELRAPALPLGMIARFTAPERFDVHQIPTFESWLTDADSAGAPMIVIDCSAVRFIDLTVVEAIEAARSLRSIEVADPSLAVDITYRLLDIVNRGVGELEAA